MARIAEAEIERLKREISVERLATAKGREAQGARQGPGGPVPLPRRSHAVAGGDAGGEPLALPGGVPGGRLVDRLGDARRGRELPQGGGAFADGQSVAGGADRAHAARAAAGPGAEDEHDDEAAGDRRAERRRRSALARCGALLPRDVEREPGGAGVPGQARAPEHGARRALPARVCEPHARVPVAVEGSRRGGGAAGAAARRGGSCARAVTNI